MKAFLAGIALTAVLTALSVGLFAETRQPSAWESPSVTLDP